MDRLCQKTHISNIELLSLLLYGYYTQVMRQTLQLDYIFRETIPAMSWMGCVQYDVGVGCHNIAMNHTTNALMCHVPGHTNYVYILSLRRHSLDHITKA
jgi:hypothetical protein